MTIFLASFTVALSVPKITKGFGLVMQKIFGDKKVTEKDIKILVNFLERNYPMDFIMIHGILAAVASGPKLLYPGEWIKFLALDQAKYRSTDEFKDILRIMLSMYNRICGQFEKGNFQIPGLDSNQLIKEETAPIKSKWAVGYMFAVSLNAETWLINKEVAALILPILSAGFSAESLQESVTKSDSMAAHLGGIKELYIFIKKHNMLAQVDNVICSQDELLATAKTIYQYWLPQRDHLNSDEFQFLKIETDPQVLKRKKVQVGRNESCPCGSGKKYKRCCLTSEEIVYH